MIQYTDKNYNIRIHHITDQSIAGNAFNYCIHLRHEQHEIMSQLKIETQLY